MPGDLEAPGRKAARRVAECHGTEHHLLGHASADIVGWHGIVVAGDPDGVDISGDGAKRRQIIGIDALPRRAIVKTVTKTDEPPRPCAGQHLR